ncbi:MAG: RHS repeat protein, partial [Ketobacter sp.]|nr:RHS repeat protein [Ketobacter sp.]
TRAYDENGNLTERVDPKGQTTTFAYDALGRETLRTLPPDLGTTDGLLTIASVFDPNNNLLKVTETYVQSGAKVTIRTYDTFDRLQTVTDRWGNRLLYAYDPNGNRTQLLDPGDAATLYSYDALNRLSTVATPDGAGLTTYTYFKNSTLDTVTYPNGTSAAHTYDASNRVETIENRHNAVLVSSFTYAHDLNGNRIEQVETRYGQAAETTTYAYELADRLTQVAYPDKTT